MLKRTEVLEKQRLKKSLKVKKGKPRKAKPLHKISVPDSVICSSRCSAAGSAPQKRKNRSLREKRTESR